MGFVANFIRFPTVQKFWKSVTIWQSYREFKGGNFFWDTVHKYTDKTKCDETKAWFRHLYAIWSGNRLGPLCRFHGPQGAPILRHSRTKMCKFTCSIQVLFSHCRLWFNSVSGFVDKIFQRFLLHHDTFIITASYDKKTAYYKTNDARDFPW